MVNKLPERLKNKLDYEFLFKSGKRYYPCSWLIINHFKKPTGPFRIGWTIPKFVGTAVMRNKFRRWCREYSRKHLGTIENTLDTNIVFCRRNKEFYKKLNYAEFEIQLQKAFGQLA